jgi:hypothetical protein
MIYISKNEKSQPIQISKREFAHSISLHRKPIFDIPPSSAGLDKEINNEEICLLVCGDFNDITNLLYCDAFVCTSDEGVYQELEELTCNTILEDLLKREHFLWNQPAKVSNL